MKVIGLNNRVCNWPPTGCIPSVDDLRPRSKLHLRARKLLCELYPTQSILEEIPIPGSRLHFDFYIPSKYLAIEVQGQQHTEQSSLFHSSKLDFVSTTKNDKRKVEWCNNNNIKLIYLNYNEDDIIWKQTILG